MLATACGLVAAVAPSLAAAADTPDAAQTTTQVAQLNNNTATRPTSNQISPRSGTISNAIPPDVSRGATEDIVVRAQRRLLKEKNSPSAVTELGSKQIAATGTSGSIFSVLRQAPSVNLYQQGIGDNAPELTIRGVRGLEVATTLDDVPTQDLLAPGSSYLQNNIGSFFSLDQIDGVSIYPGVAYPNKNTFGTIGGTISYSTKRPSNDYYVDVFGEIGSFQTYKEGFAVNSGSLDGPLGSGDNAPKVLLQYSNLQTAGYIDNTSARYNNLEFAFDKPYDDGLSKFQATFLYNTGTGYDENEPVPVPYLNRNGLYSNYSTNTSQDYEQNQFLTVILKDDTYINDYLSVGLTGFYLHNNNSSDTSANINVFQPSGDASYATVNGASPFINNSAGFGLGGLFGPGTPNYLPGKYVYNPFGEYPVGSKYCPAALAAKFAAAGGTIPCGLNSQLTIGVSDTYGIQPRATIIAPQVFGIDNTIQIGALIAKEVSPTAKNYYGATSNVAQTADNLSAGYPVGPLGAYNGGTQRTIYQGYFQDKIDLLDNTLHITPGLTVEGTYSDLTDAAIYDFAAGGFVRFKQKKWDRDYLPFFNIAYDFDKILPALKGLTAYGSTGQSALFAPVTDFTPNGDGAAPGASIVHLYEGGVKYNTPKLLLSVDYFYQKVDRDFGFYGSQSGPTAGQTIYNNDGQREFKGVEGAATWQVTPDVQLFANGSHVLAKYLKEDFAFVTVAQDQYGIALRGAPVTGVPDWLSTFGADYSHKSTLREGDLFEARVTGLYTGKQATTFDISGDATVSNFPGLVPAIGTALPGTGVIPGALIGGLPPTGCQGSNPPPACTRFAQLSGATVYDPNGGISPFATFNLDLNYTLPTPFFPMIKRLKFDLNIQNLFDARFYQYFYKQVSPSACTPTKSNPVASQYNCSPSFADAIPGQPFSMFFTVSARF